MKKESSEGSCKTSFVPEDGVVCKFDALSSAIFPKVDFKTITKGILKEGFKFSVLKMTVSNCGNKNKIDYRMTALEAAETIRYLVLSPGTIVTLRFDYKNFINQDTVNWDRAKLMCDGFTDVGKDSKCQVKCSKTYKADDVSIEIVKNPIFAKDFLEKFHIQPQNLLPNGRDELRKSINLDSLKFDNSVFKGTLSDEELTEFYVTGKPSGPLFVGSEVYLIAQSSNDANDKITMSGGILGKFKKGELASKLQALTGEAPSTDTLSVPILGKANDEMFIGIAGEEIALIYSNEVRDKFTDSVIPSSGKYLEPGCTIKYKIANGYQAFNMETEEEKSNDLLVHLDVVKNKYTFSCPDQVTMAYSTLTKLLNSQGGPPECGLKDSQKVKFVKGVVKQTSEIVNLVIYFSPSPKIELIGNDILTLTNTTFRMTKDPTSKWLLYGKGEESLLQQLTNITVTPQPESCGSILTGKANIYNMDILSDRAGAEYLKKKYGQSFNYTRSFTVENLRYEASLENPEPLR